MEPNEERNMKLKNIPFLRMWANLFNYSKREKRKEYYIDLLILTLFTAILFLCNELLSNTINFGWIVIFRIIIVIIFLFPFLSSSARRLFDAGYPRGIVTCSIMVLGPIVVALVCIKKSTNCDENTRATNKAIGGLFTFVIMLLLAFPTIIVGLCSYIAIDWYMNNEETCVEIERYEEYREKTWLAKEFLPELNELSDYSSIDFGYKSDVYCLLPFFESHSISLFVDYDNIDKYNEKKNNDLNKYDFITEPVKSQDRYLFPVAEFDYKGYHFQIAPSKEATKPKSFLIYGYNDSTETIVYLYFLDYDIDYLLDEDASEDTINSRMPDFIENMFIWYDEK